LFAEWEPGVWAGPEGADTLIAAASAVFSGFIPAASLLADAAAKPMPIAELALWTGQIDPGSGTDVLLLPKGFGH
jgi:hypothetical protein